MAETKSFDATVSTDFTGTKLTKPIEFKYDAIQYASYDEVPAESKLSPKDMLQAVNASEKAAERAKATTKTLLAAGFKKPDTSSEEYIKEQMVKMTMKLYPKLSESDARKIVEASQSAASAVA